MKIKRNVVILSLILVGAVTAAVFLFSTQKRDNSRTYEAEDVQMSERAEPSAYVVIDPGHGGKDHGASGTDSGTGEDVLNLDTARKLQKYLAQNNISSALTRNDDSALAPSKKEDMRERRRIMHSSGADLTVSIHMNKYSDRSVHGPMVFYTAGDESSEVLAECIIRGLCKCYNMPMRHANTGDYYVIRNSEIPAVIVECGFLSNPDDEKLLCTDAFRDSVARAVADGIAAFLKKNI